MTCEDGESAKGAVSSGFEHCELSQADGAGRWSEQRIVPAFHRLSREPALSGVEGASRPRHKKTTLRRQLFRRRDGHRFRQSVRHVCQ